MEEVISEYRRLLELLNEEQENVIRCFQGELLEMYRDILQKEREKIEKNMRLIYQYY